MIPLLVNLELWYTYNEFQDYDTLMEKTYELVMDDIKQNPKTDTLIGLLLCDGFLYKNNNKFYMLLGKIQEESENLGIKDFKIITGIVGDYQQQLIDRNLKWVIHNWDFSVNGIYQSYKDKIDILPYWNTNSDRFLFLGGIPSRKNRITLLSKYYDTGLLTKSDWSFFKPHTDNDIDWCRKELSHYSDEEYNRFLNQCERSVDELYKNALQYSRLNGKEWKDSNILDNHFLNDPNFIDPTLFLKSSLSVISEGHVYPPGNDYRFLTEKTWRAIINRHPFIIACIPQRMDFIKSKGLRTFEKYFINPNYAYIENYDLRLDAIVENTKHFLINYKNFEKEILDDIDFNFNRLFEIVEENIHTINSLNISNIDIDKWFNQKSFTHLFRIPE
jgi:hypothetical protein